jgi:hypothetical protein
MKFLSISFFLLLDVLCGFQQIESQNDQIILIPSFKSNQVKNYNIEYTVKTVSEGLEQIINTTKKQVALKVIDINDGNITMEWRYGKIEFVEAIPQNNPFDILMITLNAGLVIKYSINKKGIITSILNREEITTLINSNIEEKLNLLVEEKIIDPSMITTTKFQFQMMFSTPEQIDKIILSDLFKFHKMYGKTYSSSASEVKEEEDLMTRKYRVQLISVDNNNHTFNLSSKLIGEPNNEINQSFQFDLDDHWLIKYSSKRVSSDPLDVIQFYQIQLSK